MKLKRYLTFSLVLAVAQLVKLQNQPDCKDTCSCGQINLAGRFNYPVRIVATDPNNGEEYSYEFSPCPGNIECGKNKTRSVVICQTDTKDTSSKFVIGTANSVTWTLNSSDPNRFTVTYGDGDETYKNQVRKGTVSVRVVNQGGPKFTSHGEVIGDTEIDYMFEAVILPAQNSSTDIAGPIGLVIIFVLLVAFVAYLIIGGIVMYKVKRARGREVIPNYSFWISLPFLIKDGVLFTFSPCLKLCGKRTPYHSL